MQRHRSFLASESLLPITVLILVGAIVYLIFIHQFGYFNDDWYLMYAAGTKGAGVFRDIFIVDRPMRAWIMTPAYSLFGNNPVLYNLSAWGFRVLSALIFFQFLRLIWPAQRKVAWMGALLYLIYPGFLSQFNGIDYQSQMVSLALGMFSLLLLVYAYKSSSLFLRAAIFVLLAITSTLYLGWVEYFIGMEVLKLASVVMLVFRDERSWPGRVWKSIPWIFYSLLASLPFLVWRLFFFHSERGATDVDVKFSDILADPLASVAGWSTTLLQNMGDVSIWAWISPLRRLSARVTTQEWLLGAAITGLVLALVWFVLTRRELPEGEPTGFRWRTEAIWLGAVMLVFGLLPVILVGRYVDFKSFSRYALAPSIGAVLLWQAALAFLSNASLRNVTFSLLVALSALTHYGNAINKVRETQEIQNFWWQVSWRVPQMEEGTTLVANYSTITIEEDYFVWGPASLIYYPESMHADYPQPGIYSALLNQETLDKALARERQQFNNRRGIRTYPNYRNILILTQPSLDSCVHVIDGLQPEFSSFEDGRIVQLGQFSEVDHILLQDVFRQPPPIPFGAEPEHTWCYYYEKAAFARQSGNWDEVLWLGEAASESALAPKDEIEWMPFLQAYASSGDVSRLSEVGDRLTDPAVKEQACRILQGMEGLASDVQAVISELFCVE